MNTEQELALIELMEDALMGEQELTTCSFERTEWEGMYCADYDSE